MVLTLALIRAFAPGKRRIVRRFFGMACGGDGRGIIEQTGGGPCDSLLRGGRDEGGRKTIFWRLLCAALREKVGTSRCDVSARAERAERMTRDGRITPHVAPLVRGADGECAVPANAWRPSNYDSLRSFFLGEEVYCRSSGQVLFTKNALDNFETVSPVEQQQIDIAEFCSERAPKHAATSSRQ